MELLEEVFEQEGVASILSLPVGNNDLNDILIWHFDKSGKYTVLWLQTCGYICFPNTLEFGGRRHIYLEWTLEP